MSTRVRFLVIGGMILALVFAGLGQGSVAYGMIRSAIASQNNSVTRAREAEKQALVALAKADLRSRGIASKVRVHSVDPAEFPDGSLGAPEPNKPYPLAVTPGYNINLGVDRVVYRYRAANGRVVYVGSYIEPISRLSGVKGLSAK